MIQLNLLPAKVREAEQLRKILIVGGLAYVVAFGWLGWQWSLNEVKVATAQKEVLKVQAELNSPELQVAVAAVKKFADDMAAVKAKASVVNELRKQQVPLLRLLDSVPDWTMNGAVWFLTLDAPATSAPPARGATGVTVAVQGATLSRSFFAQYYDFMGSQALVSGLSLDDPPKPVTLHNIQAVQFKIDFSVSGLP